MATSADTAKLRDLGFDPSAPPDQALATLRALIGRPDADPAAIARALGEFAIVDAADQLVAMERDARGPLRREIRRALFKLRQRGVEPSPATAQPERPKPPPAAEADGLFALISPFDPGDARLVWIMKPRLQGGLTQLTAVVSESDGLVRAGVAERSRRDLRQRRAEIEREFDLKMVESDWRLADFIVCEAYHRTPASGRHDIGDFIAQRAELIAAPQPTAFAHPVYHELLTEPIEFTDELVSPELLKEKAIAGWTFPPESIKPWVDEINELQSSTLVLNPLQQQDRVEAVMNKALGSQGLFGGEAGERARRRLEDTAYCMARTGRPQPARSAAAAAAALRDHADLTRLAFFCSFIRLVLGSTLAAQEEQAKAEPHLIVTPAEAMRQQQARARPR
jgi:hypothetical protein